MADNVPLLPLIGWREWLSLPDLGIPGIKAKIDTGARSSALHTQRYEIVQIGGQEIVRFVVHPVRFRRRIELVCESPIIGRRVVRDSGGKAELRPFIRARAVLGSLDWEIDLSLTNREDMRFRMLLGRAALAGLCVVDPSASYLLGKSLARRYRLPQHT